MTFFSSPTFWANILGPGLLWVVTQYGIRIDPTNQSIVIMLVMSGINIVLYYVNAVGVEMEAVHASLKLIVEANTAKTILGDAADRARLKLNVEGASR
jgi:hypothetical protein